MSSSPYFLDKTVVLTREAELSEGLANQITELGGKVIVMPALEIQALDVEPVEPEIFDVLIFVSRNAVRFAQELIPDVVQKNKSARIYAMGQASKKDLLALGFDNVNHAPGGGGSEALLALPDLQLENVTGAKVAILSGEGGLDLLDRELHRRGAIVQKLELYRRQRPELDSVAISQTWQVTKPNAVVIYSGEGLQNLLSLVPESERALFLQTPMVVISDRLREIAELNGKKRDICVADSYMDKDILDALEKLFVTETV